MKKEILERQKELFPYGKPILIAYRGSISHGTYVPNDDPHSIDDVDLLGVFLASTEYYIGLGLKRRYAKAVERFIDDFDAVSYEFRKLVGLLTHCNPNVLSLLWLQPEHYLYVAPPGQWLLDVRDSFLSRRAYYTYTGYANSQLKKMTQFERKGYMGEKRKRLISKFGYDCYQECATEFLTLDGWKEFDSVTKDDKLGTVNIKTGDAQFYKYISRIDKMYTGKMYVVEPFLSRCVITENHNLLVSPAHRSKKNNFSINYDEYVASWRLSSIKSLLEGYKSVYHYRRRVKSSNEGYKIDDNYLKLAGLFVSDGTVNFRNGSVKSITITQRKPNNGFYDVIRYLMPIYGIKEYSYSEDYIWVLHGSTARRIYDDFGHSKGKHLPKWCMKLSKLQTEILWDSLLLGDGTRKIQYDVYYTTNKQLADQIQAMLTVAGIICVVNGPYESESAFGKSYSYHVCSSSAANDFHVLYLNKMLKAGEIPVKKQGYPIKEMVVTNERVVCFEVPNNTLITRSLGKVSLHGNCKNASHLIRLLNMGIEVVGEGKVKPFRKDDAQLYIDIKQGKWSLEKVKAEAKSRYKKAEELFKHTSLPEHPDIGRIEDMMKEVLYQHIKKNYNLV